jgi:hypothetical protein
LPPEADPERFSHFYRFAVNTQLVHGADAVIRVGDIVSDRLSDLDQSRQDA